MPGTGKFIQLIPVGRLSEGPDALYALADDGEVWFGTFVRGDPGKGPHEIRWRPIASRRA